ncbi:helix-turn-helix transcriptional regulator [Litoribacillus peritrichatus]|uniref:HTH cro/C1-type domain-containing protein n=1 Tax=Litoribacillus peritrichatus TaxID=718191 RepID=A0ABP7MTZ1_9GAMM
MSTPFSRRFQLVVDQLCQGNKKQFAELTGKSASHIYKICRGMSRPSMAYLQALYDEFKVDLNWLLTGEESSAQKAGTMSSKDLVFAPMFDVEASAGSGTLVQSEEAVENFGFNKSWLSSHLRVSSDDLAFVTVNGDSMLPTLEDGDMILVDMSQQQVNREGIYLIHTEDGLMTKRLKADKNALNVISDNPEYPSWTIDPQNAEQHRIAGKVVWNGRKV